MPAPQEIAFALFDTAIGRCGIAWGRRGVVGVQLPEPSEADTRARLGKRFPGASEAAATPPPAVRAAQKAIVALLRGETSDLQAVALDMDGVPPFHRRVYEIARAIPPGATLSYGEVAARAGSPGGARAVGQALKRNPFAIVVPCHRVLASGGKIGGFTASGGVATKSRMLWLERPEVPPAPPPVEAASAPAARAPVDEASGFRFDPAAATLHLRAADPVLARLMDAVGPFSMQVNRTRSIFGALARAIVYQQLHGKAAAAIFARVCALFPRAKQGPTAAHILGASDERLRGAGLSRPKLAALRDLAEKTAAGALPTLAEVEAMDDETAVQRLTVVRGIGRWTVEMLLMFRLGRPDVLPVDDYGIRKGFALTFRRGAKVTPEELERRARRWRPYRTVASWYLWRAAERRSSTP